MLAAPVFAAHAAKHVATYVCTQEARNQQAKHPSAHAEPDHSAADQVANGAYLTAGWFVTHGMPTSRTAEQERAHWVSAGAGDRTCSWSVPPATGTSCSPRSARKPECMTMLDDALSGQGDGSTVTWLIASLARVYDDAGRCTERPGRRQHRDMADRVASD